MVLEPTWLSCYFSRLFPLSFKSLQFFFQKQTYDIENKHMAHNIATSSNHLWLHHNKNTLWQHSQIWMLEASTTFLWSFFIFLHHCNFQMTYFVKTHLYRQPLHPSKWQFPTNNSQKASWIITLCGKSLES